VHPASAYYPYALLIDAECNYRRPKTRDDISKALETAQRFQSSPAYSHLLLRAAEVAESIAHHAFWDHDDKRWLSTLVLRRSITTRRRKRQRFRASASWQKRANNVSRLRSNTGANALPALAYTQSQISRRDLAQRHEQWRRHRARGMCKSANSRSIFPCGG